MKINKNNLPLVIAFGLPVILILIITAFVYLPSLFIKPTNKFIYAIKKDYYDSFEYVVENGKISRKSADYYNEYYSRKTVPTLYLYDSATGNSNEISYDVALNYDIASTNSSYDGWSVGPSDNYGSFFSRGSYGKIYLKGHGVTKQVNLNGKEYYFTFLGWVED